MKLPSAFGLLCAAMLTSSLPAAGGMVAVRSPDTTSGNDFYVGNRPPLLPSPLIKLPIGSIKPRGWLRKQLELEAEGFFGRLTEISRFLKKEDNAWLSPAGEGHSYWEEVPYWLKGFGDLGYVLGDERIIKEARLWIEAALASSREDGYFGPRVNLTGAHRSNRVPGKPDVWPHMIMLNVLQSHYELTGDQRVLKLMSGFFRWEMSIPEEDFLTPYWQQMRAADNLASVYWLYNRTGEKWLLELAATIHRNTADWTSDVPNWHNVNIAQAFRGPAIYYMQSRDLKHLQATERNYQKVWGMYGQVPGGMFGGDEKCRPGYSGPRQAIETCGMVEMMHSCEMLLKADGDLKWADRCDDVTFNSLPTATTADFKALRYLTAPNQVISDQTSKHPGLNNRGPMYLMNPHGHRCCQHNMGQGWPYYAEHLWLATPGGGLASVFYAECEVTAKVGDGTEVTIAETTHYPFDENVDLALSLPKPVEFPLHLRVPGWCVDPAIRINGEAAPVEAGAGSYLVVDRQWSDGDVVRLELPMEVRARTWTENMNSVSIDRGPLTYSLKIGEKYVQADGTTYASRATGADDLPETVRERWPAWEIFPTTPWNYGLVLDEGDPAGSFEVVEKPWPASNMPFQVEAAPIELRAQGRRIPQWKEDHSNLVGPLAQSPVRSAEPVETITLIPMGCARLRISAFPVIGEGPDAQPWPEAHVASDDAPVTASHCFERDTVKAVCDGILPGSSIDRSIPRMTWWPHCGSEEWVQLTFDEPRTVSEVEVYWFDDSGAGHCRVPKSWTLLWQEGDRWRPVTGAGSYGVERDKFNTVRFDPVTTRAVRLQVQLQPEFSAGILEWRMRATP